MFVSLIIMLVILLSALIIKISQYGQLQSQVEEIEVELNQKNGKIELLDKVILAYESYLKEGKAEELIKSYELWSAAVEENDSVEIIDRKGQLIAFLSNNAKDPDSTSLMQLRNSIRHANNQLEEKENRVEQLKQKKRQLSDSLLKQISQYKSELKKKDKMLERKEKIQALSFKNSKGNTIHYLGEVSGGKANGRGTGIYTTGSIYKGEWKNNQRDGEGEFVWPDGQKYVGEYKNDKREGEGTYVWPSNEKYEGEWKNDRRNGYGILYDKTENILYEGEWKNDEPL